MDNRSALDKRIAQAHDLPAGAILSAPGQRGTVIRCLRGQIWLTQEGDAQDYFLAQNTRLQVSGRGPLVINALVDDTKIAIEHWDPRPRADWARNAVWLDSGFAEAAQRRAHRERAHLLAELTSRGWHRTLRALRSIGEHASRLLMVLRGRRSSPST